MKSPSAPPADAGDPWKLATELFPGDMPAKRNTLKMKTTGKCIVLMNLIPILRNYY